MEQWLTQAAVNAKLIGVILWSVCVPIILMIVSLVVAGGIRQANRNMEEAKERLFRTTTKTEQ